MSSYTSWTREQLLEKIATLEAQLAATPKEKAFTKKMERSARPFDMSKYRQRPIALRVAYLGWNYFGLAAQGNEETTPTVEGCLLKALERCKLIESAENCQYSRCGRTDRGVSGLGQVVALNVRSKQLATDTSPEELDPNDELPYVETLNRLLPDDIRVLAWAPVGPTFNARFDCKSRTYRYFFANDHLDVERMQRATHYFEGEHDFRNFCKLDPSKNIASYKRRVLSMTIHPSDSKPFYFVELRGTAFLWHQVRCIMAVLFLVGQGLEEPEIVQELLDVENLPARPDYSMASDLPLLLYDCEFEGLQWVYSATDGNQRSTPTRLYEHWREQWCLHMTRSLLCHTFFESVGQFPLSVDTQGAVRRVCDSLSSEEVGKKRPAENVIVLGGGKLAKGSRYQALLDRKRCDSDQTKKAKYLAKQKMKMQDRKGE